MENQKQNQEPENTLSHLNNVLFGALNQVIDGKMKLDQAQAITNLGSQIINNAKTQLTYYKFTSNKKALTAFTPQQEPITVRPEKDIKSIPVSAEVVTVEKKEHEPFVETAEQVAYAKHKKYLNVVEGLVVEGQDTFYKNAAEWAEANMQPVES